MNSSSNSSREFYEEMWQRDWLVLHEIGPMTRTRYRLVVQRLRGRVRPGSRLLDAGCGSGGLLVRLHQEFPEVRLFASDYSTAALGALPHELCEDVFVGSLEDPELLRGNSFDTILCSEVLEHLGDPGAAMRNLAAALGPGGLLLVTVPHRKSYWGPQDEFAGHRRRFERSDLSELVQATGLLPVETIVWGFPFSYLYLKLIERRSPQELAASGVGHLKLLASSLLYQLFKLDDWLSTDRGFQLILLARQPVASAVD